MIVPSGIGQNVARSEDITLAYKLFFLKVFKRIFFLDLSVDGGLMEWDFFNIVTSLYFIEAEFCCS